MLMRLPWPAAAGIIKSIADRVAGLRQGRKGIPEDRVAILYNDASSFTVSTMESAEKYARDMGLTPVVRAYNGTAYPPGRVLPHLLAVREQGIRWLLVMALDPDGLDAARAVQDSGVELDVKWVTIAPGGTFFLPTMGARGAEFYMVRSARPAQRPGRRRQSFCRLGGTSTAVASRALFRPRGPLQCIGCCWSVTN